MRSRLGAWKRQHRPHLAECVARPQRAGDSCSRRRSVPARTTSSPPGERCVGGSDARIILGDDKPALLRLWREKRGEAEPQDMSGNLVVQLGAVTEELNRRWYEASSGQTITKSVIARAAASR
jgi:hypothetical protein